MRLHYVKTSNHDKFMAGIAALDGCAGGSRILLLTGDPGTGKSSAINHFGASKNAIYLEGMPGMSPAYARDYLSDQTGAQGKTRFLTDKALVSHFQHTRQPIMLDEAQHGLPDKGAVLEYLRRLSDRAGCNLILVCHTSERHRFAENNQAHIGTRIGVVTELKPASLADTALYLSELCEIPVDDGIVKKAHEQSRGRYRLLARACVTLEALGAGKTRLTETDVKGYVLCEDAMKNLRRGA